MKTSTSDFRAPVIVPALEPGDHLTCAEFELRDGGMRGAKKAELIERCVVFPSPTGFQMRSPQMASLVSWLTHYQELTQGVQGECNRSVRLDLDNVLQPPGLLFLAPRHGARVRIGDGEVFAGVPELVAEVAASAVSIELHTKMRVYRRNGVNEYLVWRVLDAAVDWFALRHGDYVRLEAGVDGWHRSEVFPGLWLDAAALVRGDLAAVLQVLQQGLASPEHAEFVKRLNSK